MPPRNYFVVSHTHWDREWYEPFEVFRYNLIKMIDYLLEVVETQTSYRFNLDCQTIVLEDYLTIRPENRERLRQVIAAGNVTVGPWYVQNDFYQTCGESTIRNLLTGIKIACDFGMKEEFVGYAPDHAGITSQLPQILNGFGIDSLLFGRGLEISPENGKKNTFIFEAPDGSRLLTVYLFNFYNNAQRFSADPQKAWRYFEIIKNKEEHGNATDNFLLLNGVDHLFPQKDLNISLSAIQERLPAGDRIFQSTFYEYISAQKRTLSAPHIHHGELAKPPVERLLANGTLSGRIAQKAAINEAENTLFIRLQGLAVMMLMSGFNRNEYDRGFFEYLWRLLSENLAHDSVWGCSTDAVHAHIDDRLSRFNELATTMLTEKLNTLVTHCKIPALGQYKIIVFNPLPYRRTTPVEAVLDIAKDEELGSFILNNSDNVEIVYHAEKAIPEERALRSPVNLPGRIDVFRRKISFTAELPAFGYRVYTVQPVKKTNSAPVLGKSNKFLRVEVTPSGQINLTCLASGRVFNDVLVLEDTGDLGDAYTYKPAPTVQAVSSRDYQPTAVKYISDAQQSCWTIDYALPLPVSNNAKRTGRATKKRKMPIRIILILHRNCPYLEVKIEGNNNVDDHFLRAVIRTKIDSEFTQSTGIFEIADRDRNELGRDWRDRERAVRDLIKIQTETAGGFAVLTGLLHSMEHFLDRTGEIGIGILRGNRYILGYYETPKDKTWVVPDNQQRGPFQARFALMPCNFATSPVEETRAAQSFANPPATYSDSSSPDKFSGGRPCVQDSDVAEIFKLPDPYEKIVLPKDASYLDIGESALLHSTVKMGEDGKSIIARFWNIKPKKETLSLRLPPIVTAVFCTNLAEEQNEETIKINDNSVNIVINPAKIVTLKLQLDDSLSLEHQNNSNMRTDK
ncbi:MAG: glycosyl hydrolase-related protein [Victivallales bacterium]|jgi:alpha-mannosidase|nr:glycosyl hydrolase-related protein [Victivallales bacterium]